MLKFAEDDETNEAPKKRQNKERKFKKMQTITAEEEDLASELFGDVHSRVLAAPKPIEENSDGALWKVDTLGDNDSSTSSSSNHRKRPCEEAAAAWVDEDDEDLGKISLVSSNRLRKLRTTQSLEDMEVSGKAFEEKLRARFQSSQANNTSSWAKLPEKGGEDEEDFEGVLRSTAPMKKQGAKNGRIAKGELDILRCKDANAMENSRASVRVVSFHPKGELLMTAGLDKTVSGGQMRFFTKNKYEVFKTLLIYFFCYM